RRRRRRFDGRDRGAATQLEIQSKMSHEEVTLKTQDGECPAYVFIPASEGRYPAVIFYFDAGGIRPTVFDMAQRLADGGYVVLAPALSSRYAPYGPFVPAEVLKDMQTILGPLRATTGNDVAAQDTAAFISYLDTRTDIVGKFGAVGFCMGGGMAITSAGT